MQIKEPANQTHLQLAITGWPRAGTRRTVAATCVL